MLQVWLNQKQGYLIDWLTQAWVKITGQKIDPADADWLPGPYGDTRMIKDRFIKELAASEGLEISKNHPDYGLLSTVKSLGLSEQETTKLNPRIIDFYEKTARYNFEVWSQWRWFFYPFGWLVNRLFSKRLQQLNLPLSPLDASLGIKSEILKLNNPRTAHTDYTIWYRTLKSSQDVIYAGIYTTCYLPKIDQQCLKVIFPLPNGNATVIMSINVLPDGSLDLRSDGNAFGEPGFYFLLTDGDGNYWSRYVKTFHENIHVYEDNEGVLRTDHNLCLWGMQFLKLHYRINPAQAPVTCLPIAS